MKILLSFCLAMVFVSLCRADIGWTPQQCDNQYGTPYCVNISTNVTGHWSQCRVYCLDPETRLAVFFKAGDQDHPEVSYMLFATTYGYPKRLLNRYKWALNQMRPSKGEHKFYHLERQDIKSFGQPFLVSCFNYLNMHRQSVCELIICRDGLGEFSTANLQKK